MGRFLRVLRETGNVDAATDALETTREAVDKARERNADFARGYDQAIALQRERMEERLIACALGTMSEDQRKAFDPVLASRLLHLRVKRPVRAAALAAASQEKVDAALRRKLDALTPGNPA